jgi:hypothetical protein
MSKALLMRRRVARWPFAVAAIPFAILALLAIEYNSFAPYAWLTALCLLNAVYPTLIGWILFAGLLATLVFGWI